VEHLRLLSGELGPAQRDDLHNRSLPRRNFSNASRNAFSPIGAAITSFLRLPSGSFVSAYGLVIAASGPRRLRGEPADHQLQLAVLKGRNQRLLAADDPFNLCLRGSGNSRTKSTSVLDGSPAPLMYFYDGFGETRPHRRPAHPLQGRLRVSRNRQPAARGQHERA
jgi:hypothetical protein